MSLSRYRIGDLALRSALELERARVGSEFNSAPLRELSVALRHSVPANQNAGHALHLRPGYVAPFERVYRSRRQAIPKNLGEITAFIESAAKELDSALEGAPSPSLSNKLVDLCLELNKQFVRRQVTETRGRRGRSDVPASAFVG